MIDGMAIRKQMIYDKINCKYAGFIDYGNLSVENGEEYVSEALVFMLTGLKTYWKCPVGYFLTNKCNSEIQTSRLKNCFSLAAVHGLRVWSVTCDGTSTNLTMLKTLGCKFTNSFETMVTKFKHPTMDYYVYCTLDACHIIKLARNALGDLGCFKTTDGKLIEWQFIKNLIGLQIEEGFNIANKLNSDHLNWQRQKMKKKLAAQTFSSSTAAALQFLQQKIKHEKFISCTNTIVFVTNIDRLIDFLNSRHPASSGFKSPIQLSNFKKKKH